LGVPPANWVAGGLKTNIHKLRLLLGEWIIKNL
jgi:hypothetical protein